MQRKIARVTFGLYASDAYLDARGTPDFARGCAGHLVVGFNDQVTTASDGAYLDAIAPAASVSFRSNSRDALARAAAAGAGIACLRDRRRARAIRRCVRVTHESWGTNEFRRYAKFEAPAFGGPARDSEAGWRMTVRATMASLVGSERWTRLRR